MSFCAPVFSGASHPSAIRVLPRGIATIGVDGAKVIDVGEDFIAMVAARRAYLAASRIGLTAGRMLEELARIVN